MAFNLEATLTKLHWVLVLSCATQDLVSGGILLERCFIYGVVTDCV